MQHINDSKKVNQLGLPKIILVLLVVLPTVLYAQIIQVNPEDDFTKELIEEVNGFLPDIVDLGDTLKYLSARNTIIKQYIELRKIDEIKNIDIATIVADNNPNTVTENKKIDLISLKSINEIYVHHGEFLGRLRIELNLEEIEKIKSGMTQDIFTTLFESYLASYPNISDEQNKYIYANLYAAQELATDELSAEKRNDIFESYKSHINLYLASDPPSPEPDDNPEYTAVLINRVDGFLPNIISQTDSNYTHIREIVVNQYKDLAGIHDKRDADIEAVQKDNSLDAEAKSLEIDLIKYRAERDVRILHAEYLGRLNSELDIEEVEGIKCWISYNTIDFTYTAYLEEHPEMTESQKKFTYGYLFAAKELAMDKGSSDEKHEVFGKYKGIINNYLSGLYDPNSHLDITWEEDSTMSGTGTQAELVNKPIVYVYPNPVSDFATIEITNAKEISSISLYRVNGQKLLDISDHLSEKKQHFINFDASGLAVGIYFICVESANNQTILKLVK